MGWFALLLAAMTAGTALGQNQVPSVRAFPTCRGTQDFVTIKMDVNGAGNAYRNGDRPTTLPENITVTANRPGMLTNEIRVFNTRSVSRGNNLFSRSEGNVLIIPQPGQNLNDNPTGGRFKVRFGNPLYELREVKVLGTESGSRSFIVGRDRRNRKLSRFNFPAPDASNVSVVNPVEWFNRSVGWVI